MSSKMLLQGRTNTDTEALNVASVVQMKQMAYYIELLEAVDLAVFRSTESDMTSMQISMLAARHR